MEELDMEKVNDNANKAWNELPDIIKAMGDEASFVLGYSLAAVKAGEDKNGQA